VNKTHTLSKTDFQTQRNYDIIVILPGKVLGIYTWRSRGEMKTLEKQKRDEKPWK